jgi:hypothetical protein
MFWRSKHHLQGARDASLKPIVIKEATFLWFHLQQAVFVITNAAY